MKPIGYIISVSTSVSNTQVIPVVLKIAGRGQMIFGSTMEDISNHLFVIRDSEKSAQEITTELQAVPGFSKVAVVALSKPVNETEIAEVRKLFAGLDWDTSNVTDDELTLFIDDKLPGQYRYYIDLNHNRNGSGKIVMRIKRLEDHPQFTPDWLISNGGKKEELQSEKQSFDDIETHEIVFEMIEKEEIDPPPPPPPPPPANLDQMTDNEVRDWMKKNEALTLKGEDIEIKRTSEEIFITIKVEGETETLIYKLKK